MAQTMWEQRPFENFVEHQLKSKLKSEGNDLWARYVVTRDEIVNDVLPWIAAVEPNLTDHGTRHIGDVIDNAALLLGLPNQHNVQSDATPAHLEQFSSQEWLVLLLGLVLHDVGNIYGRNKHNQKIPEVWKSVSSAWHAWSLSQRSLVIAVGRAHSGKTATGSADTLEPLAAGSHFFDKVLIRAAEIAAIIRFADELAEGPQRTSQFMIDEGKFSNESVLYHHYAKITQVSIDRDSGRVALTYSVDVDDKSCPSDTAKKKEHVGNLLALLYSRAAKMNYERQFARHYSAALSPFKMTSISLNIYKDGLPLDLPLTPIVLTDMTNLHTTNFKLEQFRPDYEISEILKVIGL